VVGTNNSQESASSYRQNPYFGPAEDDSPPKSIPKIFGWPHARNSREHQGKISRSAKKRRILLRVELPLIESVAVQNKESGVHSLMLWRLNRSEVNRTQHK
jgi:hypothetical protein